MDTSKKTIFDRLEIREISDSDYKIIHNLCVADKFYKYAKPSNYFSRDIDKGNLFNLVAYDKLSKEFIGQIKGFFPIGKSNIWIQTLLVSKKYLRQGYGTEIYRYTINEFAKDSNISKIYLTCFIENLVGISFWKKQGFVKSKELVSQLDSGNRQVFLFEKNIDI